MRKYLSRLRISPELNKLSTGQLGEKLFENWFSLNYQGEKLFKQMLDRDYEKIDFACQKGYTYQVKATRQKTYTFNCSLDNLREHLNSDVYVFIQIKDNIAYIEPMRDKNYVLTNIKQSFKEKNQTFVYAEDLLQSKLFD